MTTGTGPTPTPTQIQPVSKSGRGPWMWVIIMVCIVILLMVAACAGACAFGALSLFRMATEPMDDIVAEINNDTRITDHLGQPIELAPFWLNGDTSVDISDGRAELSFKIQGPNGQADVAGTAVKEAEKWTADNITVTFDDGTSVDLTGGSNSGRGSDRPD